jgi:uncharacterized lipoprotein YajG
MKKFLVILMVVAVSSFLFVGCLPGTTTPVTPVEPVEPVEPVVVTTVAPIIIAVTDGAYISKVEAADGIIVNGTAPTYSEVKIYINDICAGTGDTLADGTWIVVVAKADLGADGDKVLYATAKEAALAVSAKSNEKKFTLDTVYPKIKSVKARGEQAAVTTAVLTYQTLDGDDLPIATNDTPLFTAALFDATQLMAGVTTWKIEILTIAGVDATVRVTNLTAGTAVNYTFTNTAAVIVTTSNSWIPGATVTVNNSDTGVVGLNPLTDVGAYCLVTTTDTAAIPGRVNLAFDGDVTWTQATGGAYTINAAWGAVNILLPPVPTVFFAYNETTDTMLWQSVAGSGDLLQGDWLTFSVSGVADLAGNAIPVTAPETANTVVLASTIVIVP